MATKRFSKVSPAVWRSRRFTTLSSTEAKLLYLYFVTSEHQTSIGAYSIPTGYAIADLGWKVDVYEAARAELEKAGLIVFDDDTSTVYVLRWFKHSPPMNMKHLQGCQRLIGELASEMIAEKVQADLDDVEANRSPIPDAPNVSPALMGGLRRSGNGTGRW